MRPLLLAALMSGCGAGSASTAPGDGGSAIDSAPGDASTATTQRFTADAWADNWFAAYLGERLLKEDSVPITTERSFNAESFSFEAQYPFVLSFVLKDYKENDSGLEYIGKPNQQIGDGGFVFQLHEADTGKLVLVSDASWRCLVIHRAPLNPTCEKDPDPLSTCRFESAPEPAGFRLPAFDDSPWPAAVEFTAAAVGPKDGYATIRWEESARFVWSSDLKLDNTVLCRAVVRKV